MAIDKAKEDITKGYNAAVKLIKEAFCDAKKIGYKMPMSKSSDTYKLNKHLGYGMLSGLNNVIIDELNSKELLFNMKHVKENAERVRCVDVDVKVEREMSGMEGNLNADNANLDHEAHENSPVTEMPLQLSHIAKLSHPPVLTL